MTGLKLGYTFRQAELLQQALTHRSAAPRNNERLEFLGDSLLNMIVAEALFERFPDAPEGDLSRLRARLVNGETLGNIGLELNLGEHLVLGSGEMKSGGRRRKSILADTVEALIGAVYLDSDFATCRLLVRDWIARRLDNLPPVEELKDAKTRLQEYLQGRQLPLPTYALISAQGADHARTFVMECRIDDLAIRHQGEGRSRRKAEQAAARTAFEQLTGKQHA